jgi:hypothetical protein
MNIDTKPIAEPYFTVEAVAEHLQISKDTTVRLFADRPGVIDVAPPPTTPQFRRRRRPKRHLRISQSALERFLREQKPKTRL